jgi:hypothetical protein
LCLLLVEKSLQLLDRKNKKLVAARYSFPGLNKSFEAVSAIFATEDLNRLDNSPDDLLACVEASSK